MKKLLILSLLILTACDPKDASVESRPFEKPSTEGFSMLGMNRPLTFSSSFWLFWKDHNDMAEVMRAGAAVNHLAKSLEILAAEKERLTQARHRYLLESLGSDNQSIWEDLDKKFWQAKKKEEQVKGEIEIEYQRPAEERDFDRIDALTEEWEQAQVQQENLQRHMQGIEQQSGVEFDFKERVDGLQHEILMIAENMFEIGVALQQQQIILTSLAEIITEVPDLILHEKGSVLSIELVGFQNGEATCSTDNGGIQGVTYKKDEGIIEFLVVCKQPEASDPTKIVSYGISLEKIPNADATILSGNLYRCADTGADGKCLVPVTYGTLEYKR